MNWASSCCLISAEYCRYVCKFFDEIVEISNDLFFVAFGLSVMFKLNNISALIISSLNLLISSRDSKEDFAPIAFSIGEDEILLDDFIGL